MRRRVSEFRPQDAERFAVMLNGSDDGWPGGFTGGVPMTAAMVTEWLRDVHPLATFLAWEDGAVAGCCTFLDYPEEPGVAGYVGLLNVATAYQGLGHGRDLLRAALRRCIDLGYRRLDLNTWPGNMKAVPLYKKSGYFWVPDSTVHMENYLPLLLGMPALAGFWAEADWYADQVRDLSVKEDLHLDGAMRVYPYEFRHGDRYVRATIDATAKGLTALETESWRVACKVGDRHLIAGRPGTVRWEVENRTGRPLPVTLLAEGRGGLRLRSEAMALVAGSYATEADLSAGVDLEPGGPVRQTPGVGSVLVLDGVPIRLETGVEVTAPIDVRFSPRRVCVAPGIPQEVALEVRSNLDQDAEVALALVPSPGLRLTNGRLDLRVPAKSYGGAALSVSAAEAGAHELEVRGSVAAGGEPIQLAPVRLPLPAAGPGAFVAFATTSPRSDHGEPHPEPREVRVETGDRRLVVRLERGGFQLEDTAGGPVLAGALFVGPPAHWWGLPRLRPEATIEHRGGAVAVVLRGPLPYLPGAGAEHELSLSGGGLLRLGTTLTNAGATPLDAHGITWLGPDRGAQPTVAVPTVHGLVVTDDIEFPDWREPALERPEQLGEGWVAYQGERGVAGVLWQAVSRMSLDGQVELRHDLSIEPGGRRELPPVYLYAGPGDWRTVRAAWRRLVRPGAPAGDPTPRDVVALTGGPVLIAGEPCGLGLDSLANREAAGHLTIEAPAGWELRPGVHEVAGLRIGAPAEIVIEAHHDGAGPAAAAVRARLRTERADTAVLDGALIDLGDRSARVTVEEGVRQGHRVLIVDNGYLRFAVAAGFAGSVVSLETRDGIEHLLSAFPESRSFGWMRPWYGGLSPVIYEPGPGGIPDIARLHEETFEAEKMAQPGANGRTWEGVAVTSSLQGRGLRGLRLRADYLTAPGSNLLVVRVAACNRTGTALQVRPAALAFLRPGGSVERAELLHPAGSRLLRAQRTVELAGGPWVGVKDAASGRTLALAAGPQDVGAMVRGIDWGNLGAHAALTFQTRLRPDEEVAAHCFVALARDETEARAYGSLARLQGLP